MSIFNQKENTHRDTAPTYLGYVYDENGFHGEAVELHSAEEVAEFVCNVETIRNDKIVTDILDQKVLNTFGSFVDRFGSQVTNKERQELMDVILKKQQEAVNFDLSDFEPEL